MDISKESIKIALLGENFVGKTNLMNAFIGDNFKEDYESTSSPIWFKEKIKFRKDNFIYNIGYTIWDMPGFEEYRSINKMFIEGSKIILIVYSIDNKKSFDEVDFWIKFVKDNIENDKYIIALVANKSDLFLKQEVSDREGEEKAKYHGMDFLITSAKTNRKSIQEFVKKLITIISAKYGFPSNDKESTLDLEFKELDKYIDF